MEFSTLIMAIPIFFIAYQAIGMYLVAQEDKQWKAIEPGPQEAMGSKSLREFNQFSEKLTVNKIFLRNKKFSDRLDLLLLRSGHPFGWKAENFIFVKELTGAFLILLLIQAENTTPLLYLVGFALGFIAPDFYLQGKIAERQSAIQRQLPGFVDLLALTMEGGLDFMAAIERIMEKMKKSFLKQELSGLLQETRLGTPRKEALKNLAFRVNLPDLQSLTSIIIQSEELGTALSTLLRNYSEDMRNRRLLLAEDAAGKSPVKLLFPMVVFFFPIVFVIIFGPIALNYFAGK